MTDLQRRADAAVRMLDEPGGYTALDDALRLKGFKLAGHLTPHQQHQLEDRWESSCQECMTELTDGTRTP